MKRILNQKKIITFSILLISCAFDLAHVKYNPTVLVSCTENCPTFIIENDIFLNNLPCGYNRKIKKDSEWKMLGSIKEGKVFKPLNQCFTIECSNVFEAYLVLDGDNIIGFYLPVEDGFVILDKPVAIIKK